MFASINRNLWEGCFEYLTSSIPKATRELVIRNQILVMKRRWRSGKRAGLQNLYSRVQFPLGAPESQFTIATATTNF